MLTRIADRIYADHHVDLLHRLAGECRAAGCQTYRDDQGCWYVSSRRDPSKLHRVTLYSCTCHEFLATSLCGHLAMVLIETGNIPNPDPDSAPAVICSECDNVMDYIAGTTHECPHCSRTFTVDQEAADKIEQRLCEVSLIDPDAIMMIERMLGTSRTSVRNVDPDQLPSREDVATGLGLFWASANEIAGVLAWQRDRADVSDRMVA